jgi:hypothetical protein
LVSNRLRSAPCDLDTPHRDPLIVRAGAGVRRTPRLPAATCVTTVWAARMPHRPLYRPPPPSGQTPVHRGSVLRPFGLLRPVSGPRTFPKPPRTTKRSTAPVFLCCR